MSVLVVIFPDHEVHTVSVDDEARTKICRADRLPRAVRHTLLAVNSIVRREEARASSITATACRADRPAGLSAFTCSACHRLPKFGGVLANDVLSIGARAVECSRSAR